MQRNILIELLKNYNSDYKDELTYRDQIVDFLNNNPIFLGKKNPAGHITSSSWIISKDRKKVLLTHHNKLDKWLQLGGHTEENESIWEGAMREAQEESGLCDISFLSKDIFDIDVHLIPARKDEREHYHYDIRFIFEADADAEFVVSNESKDLKWISLLDVKNYSQQWSILRMVEKTQKLF